MTQNTLQNDRETANMNVAFFLISNLRAGAGIENVLKDYSLHKPPNVNLTILQSNYVDHERMDKEDYIRISHISNLITLSASLGKIESLIQPTEFGTSLFGLFAHLVLLKFYGLYHYRALKRIFMKFDLVYLGSNRLSAIIPQGPLLIGSEHADLGLHGRYQFFNILIRKLINARLVYRKVTGFHLFPRSEKIDKLLPKKINFVLPPRGVNQDLFYSRGKKGRPKFLTVARLMQCKGIKFLIDLWENNEFDAELHIVGDGPLTGFVKKHSDGKNILYDGKLNMIDLATLYGTSDIFLAASVCDTFSIVVVEALMSGCLPLISSNIANNFDIFTIHKFVISLPLNEHKWAEMIQDMIINIDSIRKKSDIISSYSAKNWESRKIVTSFYEEISKYYQYC